MKPHRILVESIGRIRIEREIANDATGNSDKILTTIRAEEKIAEVIEAIVVTTEREKEKEIQGNQNVTIVGVKTISTRGEEIMTGRIDRGNIDQCHQCLPHHHK
jgi:hypothetical protein